MRFRREPELGKYSCGADAQGHYSVRLALEGTAAHSALFGQFRSSGSCLDLQVLGGGVVSWAHYSDGSYCAILC